MKEITLLTWLTQLGLSVAVPLAGWILLALWLQKQLELGDWMLWIGIALGMIGAIDGLIRSLKALSKLSKRGDLPQQPVAFNDHD